MKDSSRRTDNGGEGVPERDRPDRGGLRAPRVVSIGTAGDDLTVGSGQASSDGKIPLIRSSGVRETAQGIFGMVAEYWGMETSPFVARWTPRFFVATPWYDEVTARLDYMLRQNARLGILIGDAGTGKSWCAAALCAEQRGEGHRSAVLSLSGVEPESLLPEICRSLGFATPDERPSWGFLTDQLAETAYFGRHTLLICEDVDRCSSGTRAALSRLPALESDSPMGLTVLMTTRTTSRTSERIVEQIPELTDYFDQATLTMELGVWDSGMVTAIMEQLLAIVGTVRPPFTEDAVETLVEESDGNPRRLMRLADLSLITAAASELRWVDSETVRWVTSRTFSTTLPRQSETE
ncbi:MAG: ATP-binding protein [Planctomycetia bacterium]|nr:ATP-binding protein [Planctomycetia bacterium]